MYINIFLVLLNISDIIFSFIWYFPSFSNEPADGIFVFVTSSQDKVTSGSDWNLRYSTTLVKREVKKQDCDTKIKVTLDTYSVDQKIERGTCEENIIMKIK